MYSKKLPNEFYKKKILFGDFCQLIFKEIRFRTLKVSRTIIGAVDMIECLHIKSTMH